MSIDMTLHEIRELVAAIKTEESEIDRGGLADELAGKVEALDGWMSGGGDKPDAWKETRDHR